MDVPPARELLERVRSLPAAKPLIGRLPPDTAVHLVGGAVRDLLLGGVPFDLDLVVEGDALELAHTLGGSIRVHDRFGTSTVTLEGHSYDLARSRRETYSRPGALPEVAPAPLAQDLTRRDFTVNAAAIALSGPSPGELSSAPMALEDLDARQLRVLHEGSFLDDPTRMLRLVRYASRLGFTIERRTEALFEEAERAGALRTVSGTRAGAELRLLAREDDPVAALGFLHDVGLDREIHPQFGLDDPELAHRAIALLPADVRHDRLAVALAARRMAAGELRALLDQLSFEAADRDAILAAATRADTLAGALAAASSPAAIAAIAGRAEPELVALAGALGAADQAAEWLGELRHVELEIDGSDLVDAGIPEGPAIGRGLRAALAAKLDGKVSGREAELDVAVHAARAQL